MASINFIPGTAPPLAPVDRLNTGLPPGSADLQAMAYATSAVFAELVLALQRLAVAGLADGAGDEQTEPGFTGSLCSFYDRRTFTEGRIPTFNADRLLPGLVSRIRVIGGMVTRSLPVEDQQP